MLSQFQTTTLPIGQTVLTEQTGTMFQSKDLIQLQNITKIYHSLVGDFTALKNINLNITTSEFVAIIGKSGSGKSTLINMITGIDRPSDGKVIINDQPIHIMNENLLAEWRGKNIGIVFQFFQLIPTLSAIENVMLPMDFCNVYKRSERRDKALKLLKKVQMDKQANKLPKELSGGQQQRVAIARALANNPPVIIADEPTGNLDSKTAADVFSLFRELVADGTTIVMVTHDDELAEQADRTIVLADGQITQDSTS